MEGGCDILYLCLGEFSAPFNIGTFLRYAVSRYKQHQRDTAYRIYVTDTLRMIAENTAGFSGGSYSTTRFYDIVYKKREKAPSAAEARERIAKKLRG